MPRIRLIESSRARHKKVCRKCKGEISNNEMIYSKASTIMKNGRSTDIKTRFYWHKKCYDDTLH